MGKKVTIITVLILLIIILSAGGYLYYKMYMENNRKPQGEESISEAEDEEVLMVPVEEKKVQIYQGEDRPIAVMIDNHKQALPQGGLNDAFIVYEIIVEGGESRLMAVFKGAKLDQIGPVRSARHYFLDYALENDAIYVHFGWSPQAEYDIKSLKVQNIHGIQESSTSFWRVKDKYAPHNVATSTEKILEIAERKGYRTTSEAESLLKYTVDEVNLEDGMAADTVTIPYMGSNITKYVYNPETKRYQRYSKGIEEKDWNTGEAVTAKNIIVTFARNYTLTDSENKGRQGLENIGTLKGYYITNGRAIEITCEKSSRSEKTVYKDLEGNEINVNDGNTYIQICPINAKVEIEGNEIEEEEQEEVAE